MTRLLLYSYFSEYSNLNLTLVYRIQVPGYCYCMLPVLLLYSYYTYFLLYRYYSITVLLLYRYLRAPMPRPAELTG